MRSPPDKNDKWDQKELERLKAEPWMLKLLELNPGYPHWGPYEGYMGDRDAGWRSAVFINSWKDFKWVLDEMNECVHFYFEVERSNVECKACAQSGYNPATKKIADSFYGILHDRSDRWRDKITQDEVVALQDANRLRQLIGEGENRKWEKVEGLTAEEVNAANRELRFGGFGHDGINQGILVKTRAKRLGVWGHCEHCDGHGYVFTAPKAHMNLVLWIIHPRKGCGRGVEIKNIEQENLQEVFAWLREAAQRNADRFSRVVNL